MFFLSLLVVQFVTLCVDGLGFTNIASDPSKVPNSVRYSEGEFIQNWKDFVNAIPPGGLPPFVFEAGGVTKLGSDWYAGVSVFDFDGDGYDDLFVAQSRGHASHLYRNDFVLNGNVVKFTDVGVSSGVAGTNHDSTGSCVADVDNDGDYDLVVLGNTDSPIFYRNKGNDANGNFLGFETGVVLSTASPRHPAWTSCVFGDVDGDGLNDLIISLGWNSESLDDCLEPITGDMNSNVLFMNQGGLSFLDETASRNYGMGTSGGQDTFITWAVMAADYDGDGDLDIFDINDQCGLVSIFNERGSVRILENDGTGHFTEVTVAAGTRAGFAFQNSWMGGCFGDFDKDGEMDLFATNFGNQLVAPTFQQIYGFLPPIFMFPSRVFWGGKDGVTGKPKFSDPHLGAAPGGFSWFPFGDPSPADPNFDVLPYDIGSSFGFGCLCGDLDNDGNTDIAYMGAMHTGEITSAENPGVIMKGLNDGTRNFVFDSALSDDVPSQRRGVKGMAMADFNNDGHIDVVSVSGWTLTQAGADLRCSIDNLTIPNVPPYDLEPARFNPHLDRARYMCALGPPPANRFHVNGYVEALLDGDLAIQMNDGSTNGWIRVSLRGTVNGKTARDGIGSTLKVTPCDLALNQKSCAEAGLKSQMGVYGNGGSTSSSHTFVRSFGLGSSAGAAAVQVKWTNGVRNNYWVLNGETKRLPQINCDISNNVWSSKNVFTNCVNGELNRLKNSGVIQANEKSLLRKGMEGGFDLGLIDSQATASATRISGASLTETSSGLKEVELIGIVVGASLCGLVCLCGVGVLIARKRASLVFARDMDGIGSSGDLASTF